MHFAKLFFLSLASLAVASPINEERASTKPNNANITVQNCMVIGAKIHTVNKTLNDLYPGSKKNNTRVALLVESQSNDINAALKNATTYIRESRIWTNENDTEKVAVAFLDYIVPTTNQLLDKLISKNHTFKNNIKGMGDTRPRVKANLVSQKTAANDFGRAAANHLNLNFRDAAKSINQDIQDHFDQAIAAFSGTD